MLIDGMAPEAEVSESETESDLGVDIALPNPDSCDISVMMFRDHVPSKG